ncbi:polysaccharide deacetylase family protein [Deefgea rivuli]|uniref:polysaccharide deacetylase family protein n=1 Tax=Deefgea rivuli TaxID=400948 RepID=UPI0006884785|nr:polysaccharide deacetylase family protein [Deefgea rivuli]
MFKPYCGLFLAALLAGQSVMAQTPPRLRTPYIEAWNQLPPAEMERQAKAFPETFFIEGPGDRKEIALTYDDGPSEDTPALLDLLKQQQVKATFFWQGQNVLKYPEIVKRALAEGHVLANHSFNHPNLTELPADNAWWDQQLAKTQQAYQKVVGFQPSMMRPPYGFLGDAQIKALKDKKMQAILWSVDSADWFHTYQNSVDEVASGKIVSVVLQYIHPEAIVLLHDAGGRGRKPTIMASATLIPQLKQQGYRFTTVDKLLNIPAKLSP